jgi:hypothetical protein
MAADLVIVGKITRPSRQEEGEAFENSNDEFLLYFDQNLAYIFYDRVLNVQH